MDPDAVAQPVALARPVARVLCSPERFALLLYCLRRVFPRVHYSHPVFASFCRGEPIEVVDLERLQTELHDLSEGLASLAIEALPRLGPGEDPAWPDLYRHAHYRGRTFDRSRVEICPAEERAAQLARWGVSLDVAHIGDVHGPVLAAVAEAAVEAGRVGCVLAQQPRSYHQPL